MAFVDRNSKRPLNRFLMFVVDLFVLSWRSEKVSLVESIAKVARKRP